MPFDLIIAAQKTGFMSFSNSGSSFRSEVHDCTIAICLTVFMFFFSAQFAVANDRSTFPILQLSARSILGTNRFLFRGNNGFVDEQLVTEIEGQLQFGAIQHISRHDPITTIEVLDPAPYFVSEIECAGLDRSAVSYSKLSGRISIQTARISLDQTVRCEYVFELASPSMTIEVTSGDTSELNSPFTVDVSNTGNVTIERISLPQSNNTPETHQVRVLEYLSKDDEPVGDSTDSVRDGTWDVLGPGDSIQFKYVPGYN